MNGRSFPSLPQLFLCSLSLTFTLGSEEFGGNGTVNATTTTSTTTTKGIYDYDIVGIGGACRGHNASHNPRSWYTVVGDMVHDFNGGAVGCMSLCSADQACLGLEYDVKNPFHCELWGTLPMAITQIYHSGQLRYNCLKKVFPPNYTTQATTRTATTTTQGTTTTTTQAPNCSVTNGTMPSTVYPCYCGRTVCESGHICNSTLNSCKAPTTTTAATTTTEAPLFDIHLRRSWCGDDSLTDSYHEIFYGLPQCEQVCLSDIRCHFFVFGYDTSQHKNRCATFAVCFVIYDYNNGEIDVYKYQAFYDIYNIVNVKSGLALSVSGNSSDNGAPVVQWDNPQETISQWIVQKTTEEAQFGPSVITNVRTGKVLSVSESSLVNGADIVQGDNPEDGISQWQIIGSGTRYVLTNSISLRVLNVYGNSMNVGGKTVQWDNPSELSSQWFFISVSLRTPPSTSTTAGTTVSTLDCHTEVDPTLVPEANHNTCQAAVFWAKYDGIYQHPDWYPDMTPWKSTWEWQMHTAPTQGCKVPCQISLTTQASTGRCQTEVDPDTVLASNRNFCQRAMNYCKTEGIVNNPQWYEGAGLTTASSWYDWQMYLSSQPDPQNCLPPCTAATQATTAAPLVTTTTMIGVPSTTNGMVTSQTTEQPIPSISTSSSAAALDANITGWKTFKTDDSVNKTQIEIASKEALAIHFEISSSSVDVVVQLQVRRLGQARNLRRLASSWRVDFNMIVPQQAIAAAQAKMNETRDDETSLRELMQEQLIIAGVPETAATVSDLEFQGTIVMVSSMTTTSDSASTTIVPIANSSTLDPSVDADNGSSEEGEKANLPMLIGLIAAVCTLALSVLFCCACQYNKRFRSQGKNAAMTMSSGTTESLVHETSTGKQEGGIPALPSGKLYHFFLSHKKNHTVYGNRSEGVSLNLHDMLDAMGWRGFFDVDKLKRITEEELQRHVRESCAMIVVLSDETCQSEWCRLEWEVAAEYEIPVACVIDLALFSKPVVLAQIQQTNPYLLTHQVMEYTDKQRKGAAGECAAWLQEVMQEYAGDGVRTPAHTNMEKSFTPKLSNPVGQSNSGVDKAFAPKLSNPIGQQSSGGSMSPSATGQTCKTLSGKATSLSESRSTLPDDDDDLPADTNTAVVPKLLGLREGTIGCWDLPRKFSL